MGSGFQCWTKGGFRVEPCQDHAKNAKSLQNWVMPRGSNGETFAIYHEPKRVNQVKGFQRWLSHSNEKKFPGSISMATIPWGLRVPGLSHAYVKKFRGEGSKLKVIHSVVNKALSWKHKCEARRFLDIDWLEARWGASLFWLKSWRQERTTTTCAKMNDSCWVHRYHKRWTIGIRPLALLSCCRSLWVADT
jgi:hypothetical protein